MTNQLVYIGDRLQEIEQLLEVIAGVKSVSEYKAEKEQKYGEYEDD